MHIPDGYLSPSTCAVLYGGTIAAWYVCLKRLKRVLLTRVVPLISVFAAFAFVVMMFNLPLPGGTTGPCARRDHRRDRARSVRERCSLPRWPWRCRRCCSATAASPRLGANCFNMAVIGSLVAYGCYRLLASRSPIDSRRRVIAAGVAGYVAANASRRWRRPLSLGIQPVLFHDAAGAPLYAPYPLKIAIPAMMIGHLTFAGIAEAVISAGLVAYLQSCRSSAAGCNLRAWRGAVMPRAARTPASLRQIVGDRRAPADTHAAGDSRYRQGLG